MQWNRSASRSVLAIGSSGILENDRPSRIFAHTGSFLTEVVPGPAEAGITLLIIPHPIAPMLTLSGRKRSVRVPGQAVVRLISAGRQCQGRS